MINLVLFDYLNLRKIILEKKLINYRKGISLICSCSTEQELELVLEKFEVDIVLVLFSHTFFNDYPIKLPVDCKEIKTLNVIPSEFDDDSRDFLRVNDQTYIAKPHSEFNDLIIQLKLIEEDSIKINSFNY